MPFTGTNLAGEPGLRISAMVVGIGSIIAPCCLLLRGGTLCIDLIVKPVLDQVKGAPCSGEGASIMKEQYVSRRDLIYELSDFNFAILNVYLQNAC